MLSNKTLVTNKGYKFITSAVVELCESNTSSRKSGAVLWCTTVVTAFDTNTDDDHGQP